jgi:hypothetical protein
VLKLILFVLPPGFDTFAVSTALGIHVAKERLKASLLMSSFEMTMPVVGLLLGRGLGAAIGGVADRRKGESEKVGALSRRGGSALLGLRRVRLLVSFVGCVRGPLRLVFRCGR